MYISSDVDQIPMEEFFMPFGGKLLKTNRWVRHRFCSAVFQNAFIHLNGIRFDAINGPLVPVAFDLMPSSPKSGRKAQIGLHECFVGLSNTLDAFQHAAVVAVAQFLGNVFQTDTIHSQFQNPSVLLA